MEKRTRIETIDTQSILSTYEGHTIFSIFWDSIRVYEQILFQLSEREFPLEEDFNGVDCENSQLRRLYRVLKIPTGDLLNRKDQKEDGKSIHNFDPIIEKEFLEKGFF